MKISIRTKLFVILSCLVVLLVIFGILINGVFLEKYYVAENRAIMVELYQSVVSEIEQNPEDLFDFLFELDRNNGVSVTLANAGKEISYSTNTRKISSESSHIPKEIEEILVSNPPLKRNSWIYAVAEKEGQLPRVALVAKTEQGGYIVLAKTMKGIRESVSIANRFYLFTGLLMMLLGAVATLFFSRVITSPLVEMSKVSRNIANLDFDKRVEIRSQDEIGALGESINNIADQLSVNIEHLQKDIERRKRLVRDLTHELKTPIAVVKGYAEGLQYGVASTEEKRMDYCQIIVSECDRMDEMVKELLDLSRLEEGQGVLVKTKFPAVNLSKSIEQRFSKALQDKQLKLVVHCLEDVCFYADYDLLQRSVDNYITNAIKYAKEGSTLHLTIVNEEGETRLEVFNRGPSLCEGDLEKIWDVFYMGDSARSRSLGSHGVGLAIVQSIITAHGGKVKACNQEDGVCFSFTIPLS
jgi:signal transduction histidine kinase